MSLTSSATVLEVLSWKMQEAAAYNRNVMTPPACVLWPDESGQWQPILPLLRGMYPYLLTLGAYQPALRTGPAIWIRGLLARQLEAADWPPDALPVVYLPGVSRPMLRAVESCPKHLQPLAELQYRGVFFSQVNHRDWTLFAFLKATEGGLGLDVAGDAKTAEAILQAASVLAHTPVSSLQGRRLEAIDFHQLRMPDPTRDLLRWMDDPAGTKSGWAPEDWTTFRAVCRQSYSFDPQTDSELGAAELLVGRRGKWAAVWDRFTESPRSYPNLPELLKRLPLSFTALAEDPSTSPAFNEMQEDNLRKQFVSLEARAPHKAAQALLDLEREHSLRRKWVWAQLGWAPLAQALAHLATIAEVTTLALSASTPDEMAQQYVQTGWRADDAMLRALAVARQGEDVGAVRAAIRAVYLPWMQDAALRLQQLVRQQGFPGHSGDHLAGVQARPGECILFADGLRYDVARRLRTALEQRGLIIEGKCRWTGLPSVTATCKPAVSPVAGGIIGGTDDADFNPSVAATGESLTANRFRQLLKDAGYQYIDREDTGDPSLPGWTERGDLDRAGHDQQWKLAWRVDEQVQELVERIESLLAAGWTKVRVVTDHGWLLVPGGLPKAQLHNFLSESRWGRCAHLRESAQVDNLIVTWRWSDDVRIALAPGVACFTAGNDYAHGGLSLQECVTEVLEVSSGVTRQPAEISEVIWRGLRCRIKVSGADPSTRVDIRTKPADAGTSLADGGKAPDEQGWASLLIEDDSTEGMAACVVVVDGAGTVLAKSVTSIGGGA